MKSVTLGGNRLGSGNKQKVELHGFERSTHDQGFVWRNTQAPGTLVPFLCHLALPGDSFDINLGADVKTHPTLGPLFGSFKLQLDVFECPIRLYHSWLHNNKLDIGLHMDTVKLPYIHSTGNNLLLNKINYVGYPPIESQQINPSCLYSYLGMRGLGYSTTNDEVVRDFNAIPLLSYWDIYKNYYANKSEEIGCYINSNSDILDGVVLPISITDGTWSYTGNSWSIKHDVLANTPLEFIADVVAPENDSPDVLYIYYINPTVPDYVTSVGVPNSAFTSMTYNNGKWNINFTWTFNVNITLMGISDKSYTMSELIKEVNVQTFPLSNIDDMRTNILKHYTNVGYSINKLSIAPYGTPLKNVEFPLSINHTNLIFSQESLGIKTYQSDIFNNWLNTEWIDGTGGINEITSVSTASGSFEINALRLAEKVNNMLNRIAVSGGSYEDWLEAVYDHTPFRKCETPIYHGGLSKEIIFQEVIATAKTDDPLGQLAGRGNMSPKHKGGQVNIKVSEPGYIIGIVSITPRIDYSQGNEFYVNHKSMSDLHVPSLDQIGFQDLVTDKMAFWDTVVNSGVPTFKSAGKQPAWIDYMTNYNRLFGNFAIEDNEMFMTLARRYQPDQLQEYPEIGDLTTYIDPTKFNYAFAQTDASAMNFWVQIGVDITSRRKMSAKLMPYL